MCVTVITTITLNVNADYLSVLTSTLRKFIAKQDFTIYSLNDNMRHNSNFQATKWNLHRQTISQPPCRSASNNNRFYSPALSSRSQHTTSDQGNNTCYSKVDSGAVRRELVSRTLFLLVCGIRLALCFIHKGGGR